MEYSSSSMCVSGAVDSGLGVVFCRGQSGVEGMIRRVEGRSILHPFANRILTTLCRQFCVLSLRNRRDTRPSPFTSRVSPPRSRSRRPGPCLLRVVGSRLLGVELGFRVLFVGDRRKEGGTSSRMEFTGKLQGVRPRRTITRTSPLVVAPRRD